MKIIKGVELGYGERIAAHRIESSILSTDRDRTAPTFMFFMPFMVRLLAVELDHEGDFPGYCRFNDSTSVRGWVGDGENP